MSIPDHSLDLPILESAKNEFLKKGFEAASLKEICERASVTTGAVYKRYKGKEELFAAVVADTIADFEAILKEKYYCMDFDRMSDEQLLSSWEMDESYMMWWFEFCFRHKDGFVMLLTCAQGTRYANFQHDWVEKMTDASYAYYQETLKRHLTEKMVSREEMHILLSAFWTTIYEPFIHGFSMDQIEQHCKLVCCLFDWKKTFGFKS